VGLGPQRRGRPLPFRTHRTSPSLTADERRHAGHWGADPFAVRLQGSGVRLRQRSERGARQRVDGQQPDADRCRRSTEHGTRDGAHLLLGRRGCAAEQRCVLRWGYNVAGQVGNGTTGNSDVPIRVQLPSGVRQVSQGGSGSTNGQTVALLANGSLWAWGNNTKGQLGNGTRTSSDVPVSVRVPSGVTFEKVDSGGYSCFAIDGSGRLWAWGGNQNGQLGTGSGIPIETRPTDVGIHLTQVSSTASNVAGFERR